jgi:hypothetical protein
MQHVITDDNLYAFARGSLILVTAICTRDDAANFIESHPTHSVVANYGEFVMLAATDQADACRSKRRQSPSLRFGRLTYRVIHQKHVVVQGELRTQLILKRPGLGTRYACTRYANGRYSAVTPLPFSGFKEAMSQQ